MENLDGPWEFSEELAKSDPERVGRLLNRTSFESIVGEVLADAAIRTRGALWSDSGSRAKFTICARPDALDRFFNSPWGYRGQYAHSVERGEAANSLVIEQIVSRFKGSRMRGQILKSLRGRQSKVWIRQTDDPRVLDALFGKDQCAPEILYSPWLARRSYEVPTPKGPRRLALAGTLAFRGLGVLVVKGGQLKNGSETLDEYKQHRAQQLHDYGFS